MLQTQVAYWTLMENVRHNKAQEGISTDTLAETIRHNKVSERQQESTINQGWTSLGIQAAKNAIESKKVRVQERANEISYMNAMSNAANAATQRYRAETERQLGYGNLAVSRQNAQSQSVQAAASASQAVNAANANIIRQKELNVKKTEVFANYAGNYVGNVMKLGGTLLK